MKDVKNIARVRKWQRQQKAKGLCIECSSTANGLRCDACNKRRAKLRKENYNKWKEQGKCCQCGRDAIVKKLVCEIHYLKQVSFDRLGTSKYWKELKQLMENQNHRCALTGDELSFDKGIELDHIKPTNRGGTDELSNVQWVTKQVNGFKSDRTQEELFILCNKIVTTIKNKEQS